MVPSIEKKGMNGHHHVMMLSSLGHGHLIPFMQIANKLVAQGFTVTLVVTFHHTSSLQKKVESARENEMDIHLVEMEIPRNQLDIVHWDDQLLPSLVTNEILEGPFECFLQ